MTEIFRAMPASLLLVLFGLLANVQAYSGQDFSGVCGGDRFSGRIYLVDPGNIEAVSAFFFDQLPEILMSDETFAYMAGRWRRTEVYFDTRDNDLLKNNQELFVSTNLTLPAYRPEREYGIYRDNSSEPSEVIEFETRNYNRKTDAVDKHPLFGRVKRSERPLLLEKLVSYHIDDPAGLEARLEIEHDELVYLANHYGLAYGGVVLDSFHILSYGVPNRFTLLSFKSGYNDMSQLTESERGALNVRLCLANRMFSDRFPALRPQFSFGYDDYLKLAEVVLPVRSVFQKYPVLYLAGQITLLSFIGALFIYLLSSRYTRRKHYKSVTTRTN